MCTKSYSVICDMEKKVNETFKNKEIPFYLLPKYLGLKRRVKKFKKTVQKTVKDDSMDEILYPIICKTRLLISVKCDELADKKSIGGGKIARSKKNKS